MMMKSAPLAYSGTQKALHWLVALMVFILIPVGFYMVWRGEATKFDALTNQLYTAHKTFGFVLLWLVVLRIAVRWKTGVPAPESTLNRVQVIVSEAVHKLLYLLLVATPLLGWLGVSAYGARGALFGLSLPEILSRNDTLDKQLLDLLLLAAPLLDWLGVSAYRAHTALIGLFSPEILLKNDALAGQLLELHGAFALAMVACLAAHVGAAFLHLIVLKDGVFRRMAG